MRISGTLSYSLVNGFGIRYVIFCQGCLHHCVGCQNPETWDINGGKEVSIEYLIDDISKHRHIDGITLSGGEPFLQQEECVSLLEAIPKNLDIWIYTGYDYEAIMYTRLTRMADYIVDGRFIQSKIVEGKMYGSNNQRIIDIKRGIVL